MELTFRINKLITEGDHKCVRIVDYSITGVNEQGASASLDYRIGFDYKLDTSEGFLPYDSLNEAVVIEWVKHRLGFAGNNFDEIMEGVKNDLQKIINDEATPNVPWA